MTLIRLLPVRSTRAHPSHDVRGYDTAKRILQQGLARTALTHKRERPMLDAEGQLLHHASQLAFATSESRLERLAHGWQGGIGRATQRWCLACSRAGGDPWHQMEQGCPHA